MNLLAFPKVRGEVLLTGVLSTPHPIRLYLESLDLAGMMASLKVESLCPSLSQPNTLAPPGGGHMELGQSCIQPVVTRVRIFDSLHP